MTTIETVCAYCADGKHCEWWCSGKSFRPSKIVKDALEKQERYKWHDLKKNPDDLPDISNVYLTIEEGISHPMTADGYWIRNLENNVIAWRYIEPFEMKDKE